MFVFKLIKTWKLEKKAFSMTCDNASSMGVMVSRLKSDLDSRSTPLPCGGKYFHVRRCSAHILNLIVQSGLAVVGACVVTCRATCGFVDGSNHRITMFDECVVESNCSFVGHLSLDCPTRWNSTYLMLRKAYVARKAFDLLAIRDPDFTYCLTSAEWEIVHFVLDFLEPFYRITVLFSGQDSHC